MSGNFALADWVLCGFVAFAVLVTIYAHAEGNRVTATRFIYHDIRREMGNHPRRVVWWRAFNIAMGWRRRPGSVSRNSKVTQFHKAA